MADDRNPNGWAIVKLGDLGEVNRGRSRHRPRYAEYLYGGPYPFIQTGDIKQSCGRIINYKQTYSEAGLAQSRLWPAGTMCITIAANIAETGILAFPACFPDSVIGFISDKEKCNVYFIEYVFRYLKKQIQHEATGSVQDNINLATLDRLRFPLPPLYEQHAIAHILGSLDDKIELNRRTNETLEAMARAIFKSWFVDFDPVRAKVEGRDTGLPSEIADLFPDSFEDSELGEIPRGWEVLPLSEVLNIIGGGTPKTKVKEYWGGDIPWFSVVDAPLDTDVFVIDTEKYITQQGVDHSSTKVLRRGTTIISARGTVGKCALVGYPMAMNQSCYGIQGERWLGDYFVYFTIRRQVTDLQRSGHGSVFNTITRDTFKTIRIVVPPTILTNSYEKILQPFMESILEKLHENTTLISLRDTLLPKLISGELRVPDAEKFVEEVCV